MEDGGILFHSEELCHLHGARHGNPVEVVPLQIHDHQKLALVFLRGLELCPEKRVLLRCLAPFSRALDGPGDNVMVLYLQETLR